MIMGLYGLDKLWCVCDTCNASYEVAEGGAITNWWHCPNCETEEGDMV